MSNGKATRKRQTALGRPRTISGKLQNFFNSAIDQLAQTIIEARKRSWKSTGRVLAANRLQTSQSPALKSEVVKA